MPTSNRHCSGAVHQKQRVADARAGQSVESQDDPPLRQALHLDAGRLCLLDFGVAVRAAGEDALHVL
ncbi:hypothetical protein CKY51_17405 [Xanthomonas maliensis]|nr:hypothetical protein CKY51_17405 [Xanthomonas maliensis]